ncbi:anaerobic C4-dicarboxylate transporter [Campylobacter lari]|uniref:anaerobic C4-dicarboxylate transporter family protein n=1 Tax=Campylobacter lari TaxID=201 RepID=UPI00128461BF|nr:anaerobic C4-dicarboxylate transporter family protein [Campylobacter lari]EAH8849977.1 anaerobic C4-dicarboxylate transporter [Campylobacter lari]EAH9952824.1 anaerobic C4-dicarboxylate transporter [Campylobacter lari]EAI1237017.1 anaerobic C4-dicarboxylate transporter [Campylobacter lari]EAI4303881.1 anaerobic C4-dicarboxylate transporter [Campylobacter lari]EAI5629886.1 anaerobic C4-dicarboxylate transporter [Campylobacter lari]
MDVIFILEFFIIFSMIAIGGRYGGIGLGVAGGLGMCILVLVFGMQPASLPVSVVFIILAVITCVSVLQSAGGLDLLVKIAEKILKKKPQAIVFMGPLISSAFTIFCGTTYVAFSIYPVIAEVAADAKIRPERALSVSVVAAGIGVIASPMSAATAAMVAVLAFSGTTIVQILIVSLPAFFIGVFLACLSVLKRGKELEQDEEFQKRVRAGEYHFLSEDLQNKDSEHDPMAKRSLYIFALGILTIIFFGTFTNLLPHYEFANGKIERLSTPNLIQMIMLATACLIMLFAKVPANKLGEASVFRSGLIGVVGVFGIAWMTGTFFETYKPLFSDSLSHIVEDYPYLFGVALFAFSMVIFSPSATVAALMPLGVSLGIPPQILIVLYPCVSGDFIVPGANQIACVAFDRTGTTKIGKFVINHSYLRPGFVLIVSATIASYFISKLVF